MAEALRPLMGDALAAPLNIRRDDELDLGKALIKTKSMSVTRQRLTLYSWGQCGKQLQGYLRKYLRMPSSVRGVVVEERVWHGLSTTPPPGDLDKALISLVRRGEGIVVILEEPGQRRAVVYDMEDVSYKLMEKLDWVKNYGKGAPWLVEQHGFSKLEAWWWMYLNQPEVRTRIAATKHIELVIM